MYSNFTTFSQSFSFDIYGKKAIKVRIYLLIKLKHDGRRYFGRTSDFCLNKSICYICLKNIHD